MNGPTLLARVVVGSRLHNLATENSDWDIREVVMSPLINLISPFRQQKAKQTQMGDDDVVRFELSHFVKLVVQGNPTMIEMLWSNQVQATSLVWERLRGIRQSLLDSHRLYDAHLGYSRNQHKSAMVNTSEEPPQRIRRGKFMAAAIRSTIQGIDLLSYGNFSPQVTPRPDLDLPHLPDLLMEAKRGISHAALLGYYYPIYHDLTKRMTKTFKDRPRREPDIERVEAYLYGFYTGSDF